MQREHRPYYSVHDLNESQKINDLIEHLEGIEFYIGECPLLSFCMMEFEIISASEKILKDVSKLKVYPLSEFSIESLFRCLVLQNSIHYKIEDIKSKIYMMQHDESSDEYVGYDEYACDGAFYVSKYIEEFTMLSVDFIEKIHEHIDDVLCMYKSLLADVEQRIDECIPEYSNIDLIRMINLHYRNFWEQVWKVECRKLTDWLNCNESQKELYLKEMRVKLQERMQETPLSEFYYRYSDLNDGTCDYEGMVADMFDYVSGSGWNIQDLNDYFDIIIRREYVERMLLGKGAPPMHDLIEVEGMDLSTEVGKYKYQELFDDFLQLFESLHLYIKEPYTMNGLLKFLEELLLKDEVDEIGVNLAKFIQAKKNEHVYRTVSITRFFYLVKLFQDEGIVECKEPIKIVSRVHDVGQWDGNWNFQSVFSKRWEDAKDRVNSRIKEDLIPQIKANCRDK